jgi:hypothetical protein
MSIPKAIVLSVFLTVFAADCSVVVAQTSMGGSEATPSMPPQVPSTPPPPPAPAPRQPRMDFVPNLAPSQPAPRGPDTSAGIWWGAIGFTADGSYSTVWKMASQAEAEAAVAKKCAEYGRGACKVVAISGPECIALSTFNGSHKRTRWNLSFTAGGNTYPEATRTAMDRCNSDERSRGRCVFRVAACADGR